MKSHLTKDFRTCFSKLPERVQRLARENYKLWKSNPYHPGLDFKRISKKYPASFKSTLHFFRAFPICRGFFQKTVKYFWGHMKDAKYPTYSVRIGIGWRTVGLKKANAVIWFWIGSHADYDKLIQQL